MERLPQKEQVSDHRQRLLVYAGRPAFSGDPAGAALRLTVRDKFCFELCTIRWSVIIERNQDNRRFTIHWEGEDFEGTDSRPHEGENAPYQIVGLLKDLPSGHYTVTACIYRLQKVYCDDTTMEVVER